jgi:tRNA(fMet)-specific endonuclease VapC
VKVLLDTDAYSQLKRGHPGVADLVRRSEAIVFSPIVAGELLYGFRHGDRFAQNVDELRQFLDSDYVVLAPVTLVTVDRYSRIALALKRKGRPLSVNDIWIAAHALETGSDLVSFDRHFGEIDGLAWVDPASIAPAPDS